MNTTTFIRAFGTLALIGFLVSPFTAESNQAEQPHSLQIILFEGYLTSSFSPQNTFDLIDMPSNEFAMQFSRLFVPYSKKQTIALSQNIVLPKELALLDVHTLRITEQQIQNKIALSHRNDLHSIKYDIGVLSWSKDSYQIELEGRYEKVKFKNIAVEADSNKTKLIRIRYSAFRTLYIALTPLELPDELKGITPPKAIIQTMPTYPSELSKVECQGRVLIRVFIDKEGKIDKERLILLECPHSLFARNSLDAAVNQWTFTPATQNGVSIDFRGDIEVSFRILYKKYIPWVNAVNVWNHF